MTTHHHHHGGIGTNRSPGRFAFTATLHCLLGCGIGEVVGMIIGTSVGMGNAASIILAVLLGFVFGFALGIIPWIRAGESFPRAMLLVLTAEGPSIVVMETAEVLIEMFVPGVMQAHLHEPIFWIGMLLALLAGFAAAYPVNYLLAKREKVRQPHSHHH